MSTIALVCSGEHSGDADRGEVARELGLRACAGDFAALDELEKLSVAAHEEFHATQSRKGFNAIRPAFDILGKEAGKGNRNALEAILRGLRNDYLDGFSCQALGLAAEMGNEKALEPLLEPEKHGMLLSSAVGALSRVAKTGDQRAVDFLVNVTLDERNKPLWFMAADGLGAATAKGNSKALRALTSLLDRDASVRPAVVSGLREAARTRNATKASVPTLVSLISKSDLEFRSAAMEVLASIGPDAAEAVPVLISLLPDANLRLQVIETLVKIGPPAIPHLAKVTQHENEAVRHSAKQVSKRIVALAGSGQAPQAAEGVIANVLNTEIYATELDPPQDLRLEKMAQLSAKEFHEWYDAYRNEQRRRINSLMLNSLFAHYDEKHALAPTENEIEAYLIWFRRSQTELQKENLARKESLVEQLRSERLPPQERGKMEEELALVEKVVESLRNVGAQHSEKTSRGWAKASVLSWKRNKSLFDEYGGRVIFQQLGLEPLDAYLAFLKESERRRDLAIYDGPLREMFWDYFTSEQHNFLSPEESNQAMAKPMWLKDAPE